MDAREGIERLLFAYGDTIDRGDFAATGQLFAPDGIYAFAGATRVAQGPEQVTASLAGNVILYDGVPRTRHCVTNMVIDLHPDGTQATVQSYVHVHHQPPGRPLSVIAAGTYRDHVHVVDGTWRFVERRMHVELVGDMSTHAVRTPLRNS